MLKVLWLAPYYYDFARGRLSSSSHPAPWVIELAKEISNHVELTIANWEPKIKDIEEFERDGIKFIFIKSPRARYDLLTLYTTRINKLTKHLMSKRNAFDLIHVHGLEHQYEIIARRLGLPFVVSVQGILKLCRQYLPSKMNDLYIRWTVGAFYEHIGIKRSKTFLCRTKLDTGYILKLNPRAEIIHNWEIIRQDFFSDCYNDKKLNLLFLGGTSLFKGFRETLRCANLLKERGKNVKLRICGYGDAERIGDYINKEKMNISIGDIEFLGHQSETQLVRIFKDTFCLVHPSYMDNSPNSICEAQVAGLPVVASDVGGVGSLIDHGTTGLLVKRYDHIDLADQICRLHDDGNLYRYVSKNSKRVARERHNREQIVRKTLDLYNNMSI